MILSRADENLLIRLGIPDTEVHFIHTSHEFNVWMERLGYQTRAIPGELTRHTCIRLKSEVGR